ncbi:RDD family protein [Kitasatospora sp. NPDC004745]|uniref:RDD family protein n=1 Tax=Kitasatospora sp. NPDC004745 TaxID=3364019 RepID=UPI0036997055
MNNPYNPYNPYGPDGWRGPDPYPHPGYPHPGYPGHPAPDRSWSAPMRPVYASWKSRVAAFLLGCAIELIPLDFFVFTLLKDIGVGVTLQAVSVVMSIVGMATFLHEQGEGQTTGMKLVGIKLVRERDGSPIGLRIAILRQFAHLADSVMMLGLLWPMWDPKGQTFADKICGTVVIRTR